MQYLSKFKSVWNTSSNTSSNMVTGVNRPNMDTMPPDPNLRNLEQKPQHRKKKRRTIMRHVRIKRRQSIKTIVPERPRLRSISCMRQTLNSKRTLNKARKIVEMAIEYGISNGVLLQDGKNYRFTSLGLRKNKKKKKRNLCRVRRKSPKSRK